MSPMIRPPARLAARFAMVLALVLPAGQARAQGPVLPLPAEDQQKLAANLGPGVVGAALPSERIGDVSAYFPLNEKTFVFQVTSGSNAGNTQNLVLKKARRPSGAMAWRFNFAPSLAGFLNLTGSGDLMMPAVSDVDEGVVVVTTPANPFVLTGMKPGESRTFRQKVSVNYLDDPTKRDWGGRLNAAYTYVGTYKLTVPAGVFDAILIRFAYRGKVGPADVVYTAWYFFARDVGLVAMVNLEDVSAFWIYHNDTTIGKVLSTK
ncbi:MAG TPA: hypothetical protein VF942_05295 [Acidimicrobiales bacterium]